MSEKANELIFKILRTDEWKAFQKSGVFTGSPVDLSDGFIHFSFRNQVEETARRHFADESELHLVACNGDSFSDKLKLEPSRGGDLFPHLYGQLRISDVVAEQLIQKDNSGQFHFQWSFD